MSLWPWNFIPDQAEPNAYLLRSLLASIALSQSEPSSSQVKTKPSFFQRTTCAAWTCRPLIRAYGTGEDVRDWSVMPSEWILFPYDKNLEPLQAPLPPSLAMHLRPYKQILENSVISGSTKKRETNLKWFEFRRLARAKFATAFNLIIPQIATHAHFLARDHSIAFKEKAQAIVLKKGFNERQLFLLLGLLNSSYILEQLKRMF